MMGLGSYCDDCEQYAICDIVNIHGFEYNLCSSCELERDLNDELDGVNDDE